MSDRSDPVADRLAALRAEFLDLFALSRTTSGTRSFTEDDEARAWAVRDQIQTLKQGTARRLERTRNITGSDRGSGHDFDRDSLREPDSIIDCKFRDPWDLRDLKMYGEPGKAAAELRARALSAVEKMRGCSDAIRAASAIVIEKFDSRDCRLARHCLLTSKPAYVRAWSKTMCGKEPTVTPDERRALDEVQAFRAMSLIDTTGGYLVPWQLEPSLISISPFVRSDLRQAARVVIATGDVYHAVQSQNVSWQFQAEGAETTDNSPPLGGPEIPNWTARGWIPISIEALHDLENVEQEIGRLLAFGKQDLEATRFIVGSGLGEPTGILTSLSQSSNSGSVVTSAAAGSLTLGDIFATQAALPSHYRAAASWLGNNVAYNKIREFDRAGGSSFWRDLNTDRPPMLFNRDALEAEAMPGVVASGNKVLVFGDLQSYVITDRLGVVTELIPALVSTAHNRPTGSRGFFSWFRTGGDVLNSTGLRCLSIQ
jgi:HK97 family phage major capsid protein